MFNSALSRIKFTVLLGLIKRIPLADEHGSGAPGLAPAPSGLCVLTTLCRSAAPVGQTSGSRCFSYIPYEKSMTIDLEEIPARIHHVVSFEW